MVAAELIKWSTVWFLDGKTSGVGENKKSLE